jgi:pantoate--beta-alanine ligase
MKHLTSLAAARPIIDALKSRSATIGSVHTLGALHDAHAELIRRSAAENDITIVTVYPNRIQLFPGHIYQFNLADDVALAANAGADFVISSTDEEMFPEGFATYVDQGASHAALNSSIFPFAARGQVTGSIRWLNFTRPDRSYFGLKDIEQAILVQRAVADLLMPVSIRFVPCVRFASGVPISSRLRSAAPEQLAELAFAFVTLRAVLADIRAGLSDARTICALLRERIEAGLQGFRLRYVVAVDETLAPVERLEPPFVLQFCLSSDDVTHFDGMWIRTAEELAAGPPVIWHGGEAA